MKIDLFIINGGGYYGFCPCTKDGCAATITTRYGSGMGPTNVLSLGHFPMTAVITYEEN